MGQGGVDKKALEEFAERMKALYEQREDFLEGCAKELSARLLRKVIKRTPVGNYSVEVTVIAKRNGKKHKKGEAYQKRINPTGRKGGTLRHGWTIGEVSKSGDLYTVDIINPTEYASYVEFGHRQTPGRYVPALGKRLKKGWVKGQFMMTLSENEIRAMAPALLEKKVKDFLKGAVDGK